MGLGESTGGVIVDAVPSGAGHDWQVTVQPRGGEARLPGESEVSDDGQVSLSVLGDLYASSPSGVLSRYLHDGVAGVSDLEGSFVIVVDDRRTGETWLVNDHIGSRSAYLWELDGERLVTNSLQAGPRRRLGVDPGGVCSYLSGDGVRAGLTPYRNVRVVPPGSVIDLRGNAGPDRYWRAPIESVDRPKSADAYAAETIKLMRRSLERRLESFGDKSVALSLSGGVDSRGLLGLLVESLGPDRVWTFTYYHGEQVGDMDLPEAQAAAASVGVKHHVLPGYRGNFISSLLANAINGDSVAHFCDDVDVWPQIASYLDGAHILVAGDRQSHHWGHMPDDLALEGLLRLVSFYSTGGIEWFLGRLPSESASVMRDEWEAAYQAVGEELDAVGSWRHAIHRAYLENRVHPTLTLWRERFCSQVGPVISPYLDRTLLDFVGHLPPEFNDVEGQLMHRVALQRAFPELFARPVAHGGWNIPDWGMEMAKHASELVRLVESVDSPLEALIPKDVTLGLLAEVTDSPENLRYATEGWRWRIRRTVKRSEMLRRVVRAKRLSSRLMEDPIVTRNRLLRRLLTLHLAMAETQQLIDSLTERSPSD